MNVTITGLFNYPVKSFRASPQQRLTVSTAGLHGDRRWMVVGEKGDFLTQRQLPEMATISALSLAAGLLLETPTGDSFRVPVPDEDADTLAVQVWRDNCVAQLAADEVNGWLSAYLGRACRLVYLPADSYRVVQGFADNLVGFADGYPLLLTSTASLSELNRRLNSKRVDAVPMDRFRPNLVVDGDDLLKPFAEDEWASLTIGDLRLVNAKPCGRCTVTTVDQQSGDKQRTREPLRTLAEFRSDDDSEILFGINLVPEIAAGGTATLAVDDQLQVELR